MSEEDTRGRTLFESERSFRLLVEGVVDYALYMLDPTGIITSWNIGGQRIKGYAPEEIVGQHFSRFYTPQDRENGKHARALQIAQEQGRYEEEGWRVRKDGTFFWASVVIDPIYENGKLVGFAKITRDITERKEAQQKLEQMQRHLAESQKLDALGQLTGGVAHDFNNLLMVVSGNLHILKRAIGDNERAQRAVSAIETATRRGASLTNQLLTFARRQRVNPEAVNLADRIQEIRQVLETAAGSQVELRIHIAPDIWHVVVDGTELETALVNLIINARDAMPQGGVVNISAANVISEQPKGEFVAIAVEDCGVGIPADVVKKVFDPFFTTKAVGKGTGLGLSQVHGFAHQAGGTVTLTSELGKGTKVIMSLPRGSALARSTPAPSVSTAEGSVLLVEDNPDVAFACTALLEQLGYSVRCVPDAQSALTALEDDGVDIVFSDIVMPGKMDGILLAQTIKAKYPRMPVLLATGYAEAARHARMEFPILRKPFELHELGQALAKVREVAR